VLSGAHGYRLDLGPTWHVDRTFWVTNGSADMRAMVDVARAEGMDGFWSGFDLDGPLPPMITDSSDVDVRIPLGPYRENKLAALSAHRSQVNLDDSFWKLMTGIDDLGESFLLATGVPLADGTATDLFEGLELAP
jgi:N-acetyl-1-D-myo-inositol-2-amino-2-deoxy-alpha-D-glucopyranoside deacetylase